MRASKIKMETQKKDIQKNKVEKNNIIRTKVGESGIFCNNFRAVCLRAVNGRDICRTHIWYVD